MWAFFYLSDKDFTKSSIANSGLSYYIRAILKSYNSRMKSRNHLYIFLSSFIVLFACKKQADNNSDNRDNLIGTYRYTGTVVDTSLRNTTNPPIIYVYGNHTVNETIKIEKSNFNDSILFFRRVIQDRSVPNEGVLFETDPGYSFYQSDFNGKRFSDSFVTAKLNGSLLTIPRQIAPFTGGGINGSPIYIEGTGSFINNQISLNYSTKNTFGNHWYTITAVK
jgi:hypothetical protein